MDIPSPTPRRVSRPRWLDLRLVLGVVLVAVAVVVGAEVVSHARSTQRELAVTHDLSAGTTLQQGDLVEVDVQLPDSAERYVADESKAIGKVLTEPLANGELLPVSVLGESPDRTTVNVPFAADAAPKLSRGQRIIVWLSTARCPSVVLLPDVTVQEVSSDDNGSFATTGSGQSVMLSVTPQLAERMVSALAIENATIRAGVLSGTAAQPSAAPFPGVARCTTS